MSTPNPVPSTLMPTRSVAGGAIVGTAVAQLIIGFWDMFIHTQLTTVLAGAITTICMFVATYFIPDKST